MPDTEDSIQQNGIPVLTMEVSQESPVLTMEVDAANDVQWPVDSSLSIQGEAADAKATGDAIGNLEVDISDLSTEIEDIPTVIYPVGSIIMTASEEAPGFPGTWTEIAITATWDQLTSGKRGYATLAEGDTGGAVHFWMRTA